MRITQGAVDAMAAHAAAETPLECCGLLLGTGARVERAWPARNLEESRTRYRVDPADHFAAIRAARRNGWMVVGAYHSHPASAPVPSPRDLEEASYREYLYVIVSTAGGGGPVVEGYRMRDGVSTRVPLERER